MSATLRAPIAPIGWSIALHAVLAGLLIFGLSLPKRADTPVILPIDAISNEQRPYEDRSTEISFEDTFPELYSTLLQISQEPHLP